MFVVIALLVGCILVVNLVFVWVAIRVQREMLCRIKQFEDQANGLVEHAADVEAELREFFSSPGKDPDHPEQDLPSAFFKTTFAVSQMIAANLSQSLTASMMGRASAMKKQVEAAEGDIMTDALAGSNPMMGAGLDMFPSLKKRIQRSPMLQSALIQLSNLNLAGGTNVGRVNAGPSRDNGSKQDPFKI